MRAHPSNFRVVGFTEEPALRELSELARSHGLPVIDDIGSGVLSRMPGPLGELTAGEPAAAESVAAGADVVCFSGDKLLGGPQAGVAVGAAAAIDRMRAHPLARAVRIDKLSLAALEATLRLHREPVGVAAQMPVLEMLTASEHDLLDACSADPRRDRGGRARGQHGGDRASVGSRRRRLAAAAGAGRPGRQRGRALAAQTLLCDSAAPGRPADRRARTRRSGAARPTDDVRRRVALVVAASRRAREPRHDGPRPHPRHGWSHRPRQDDARRALTGRHRSPAAGARARHLDRARLCALDLPSGRSLSVVDVPGHERFVRTMVAGATGIDLFLLVVAANDGVMPQTREHLAVLQMLDVPAGVVALTKSDLVEPDAVALAAEVAELTAGGPYEGSEVVPVCAPAERVSSPWSRRSIDSPPGCRDVPARSERPAFTSTAPSRCMVPAPSSRGRSGAERSASGRRFASSHRGGSLVCAASRCMASRNSRPGRDGAWR